MNIAKILKNCPQWTELYTPIWGDCVLEYVDETNVKYPICVSAMIEGEKVSQAFTKNGKVEDGGEILLFPSKDNRDWSTFKVDHEFKRGDFIYLKFKGNNDVWLTILNRIDGNKFLGFVNYSPVGNDFVDISETGNHFLLADYAFEKRLATEEEKKKLLERIGKAGYSWDSEKLELVKIHPKQDLEPFEKVLVRDSENEKWAASLFSHYEYDMNLYKFRCIDAKWEQCIPYEGNEHLLGTSDRPKNEYIPDAQA